jgi:hypothetical protein
VGRVLHVLILSPFNRKGSFVFLAWFSREISNRFGVFLPVNENRNGEAESNGAYRNQDKLQGWAGDQSHFVSDGQSIKPA